MLLNTTLKHVFLLILIFSIFPGYAITLAPQLYSLYNYLFIVYGTCGFEGGCFVPLAAVVAAAGATEVDASLLPPSLLQHIEHTRTCLTDT